MIVASYSSLPTFPATDQQPGAKRIALNGAFFDYLGATPTAAEALAFLNPPRPRPLLNIVNSIKALTAPQKAAIWTDITSGSPPKWQLNTGPNSGALASLAVTLTLIAPVAASLNADDILNAKVIAVAPVLNLILWYPVIIPDLSKENIICVWKYLKE